MSWRKLPFITMDVPPRYQEEPRGLFKANWAALAKPENETQISELLSLANQENIAIIPYGGGTGLVGGQIYTGEKEAICLSMEKFKSIDIQQDSVIVGAGVILDELHDTLDGSQMQFPLSLASSGSAQIGGLIATNAGGIRALRFGTMGELTRGVRGFFGDGRLVDATQDLYKDNTGYRVDRLLIGSEGNLGIITKARLKLFRQDDEIITCLATIKDPQEAYESLQKLKRGRAPINAFELISQTSWQIREEAGFEPTPIGAPSWSAIIEIMGDVSGFEPIADLSGDSVLANSETQRQNIWQYRETIPIANRKIGSIASHDIALAPARIPQFIETMPAILAQIDDVRINCFGHMGDGNLHYNLFPAADRPRSSYDKTALSTAVYAHVVKYGGSISAEHGIGRLKGKMMRHFGMNEKLDIMKDIKKALDPNGIMNPNVYE